LFDDAIGDPGFSGKLAGSHPLTEPKLEKGTNTDDFTCRRACPTGKGVIAIATVKP